MMKYNLLISLCLSFSLITNASEKRAITVEDMWAMARLGDVTVSPNGKFIAFLDSDDLWPKDYLNKMVSALKANNDFGAAYSPITLVYTDGKKICIYFRDHDFTHCSGDDGSAARGLRRKRNKDRSYEPPDRACSPVGSAHCQGFRLSGRVL